MFRFKQFTISDEGCAMKVGTDGVLLGAWADVAGDSLIMDACTGTGIIALMVAQRNAEASIYALDIVPEAVVEARGNADHSPWGDRVSTICCDLKEYREDVRFDHIVCNPPYFVDSLLCPDSQRTTARHTTELTFEQLDKAVCRLMSSNGKFALILPTEQMERYIGLTSLNLVRRCDVHPVEGGAVKRVMAEFAFELQDVVTESIAIERGRRGDYTEQYVTLTKDFYLKF